MVTFPIIDDWHNEQPKGGKRLVRKETVPLAFVEQYRAQIHQEHYQSIPALASRGGLSCRELLYFVFEGDASVAKLDSATAWPLLFQAVKEWKEQA